MFDFTLRDYIRLNRSSWEDHSDVIFIKDSDLQYVYVNKAYLKISPNSETDIIGSSNYDFNRKELAEEYQETDNKVLHSAKSLIYEQQIDTAHGLGENYLVTKSPIFNDSGEIIGINGSARNIEHYIETREELQTNLNLIETLLDSVPYPIFIKNPQGVYMKVNEAYLKDLDLPVEDVLGKDDIELFGPDLGKYYKQRDKKVLETKERDVYISTGVRDDIRYITTKDVLLDSSGSIIGVVGIVNTFQELSNIKDKIVDMQRIDSISQLAGGIAHDLNNILANISILTGMLISTESNPQKYTDLQTIDNAVFKASELINKLSTFAQENDLQKHLIDLNQLVTDTIKLVSANYRNGYTIVENYTKKPLTLLGDELHLSQMVMNLIINGFEAMVEGTITASTSVVQIDMENQNFVFAPDNFTGGSYACLSIEDTGSGIDPTILNQIFEPYFSKKERGGTGLGLSIVYGVVTAHDGLLSLVTTLGKGTTFKVYLPLSEE